MGEYIVQPGDWLSKIAPDYGMTWEELYYHSNNAPFRALRPNPDLIYPGDVLWVPDPTAPDTPVIRSVTLSYEGDDLNDGAIHPHLQHENSHLFSYKVRTGDTLESIATAIGITWQELAILNWGTAEPDWINWYLSNYFVCKTMAGANYIFSSADVPGILLLPRPVDPITGARVRSARGSRHPL